MLFLAAACVVAVKHPPALAQDSSTVTPVSLPLRRTSLGPDSPTGLWSTVSDRDGKPTGIVEIREVDGELVGVVRRVLVDAVDSVCDKCSDERHGQPLIGMEVLRHLHRHGDEWIGGEILDPEDGKTYRATIKLIEDGKKLVVRGYIGLPMFGRSQTWVRAEE
jgi:uncharacterized protein (DUF2147 family)